MGFEAATPEPMPIRGGGDPTQNMAFRAAIENGPAAPELRRRCAWLHHGPVSI
jgi:hypothetical protein